jgi:hypothetical protein
MKQHQALDRLVYRLDESSDQKTLENFGAVVDARRRRQAARDGGRGWR